MLENFPVEILQQIVSHLPSASAIINLSLTSQKLLDKIKADNYVILRAFIKNRYPSITTPPLWKDAVRALTSRSRAWDRRALVARACEPPKDSRDSYRSEGSSIFGYVPVIDSYESWYGGKWIDRHEVLAWGAAGRLWMRISTSGAHFWSALRGADDHLAQHDILDVRLLRPHQKQQLVGETVILRRANKDIVKIDSLSTEDTFVEKATFATNPGDIDCMDVSRDSEPLIAICNRESIQIFPLGSEDEKRIQPSANLVLEQNFSTRHRKRCAKFLSDRILAVGVQFISAGERQGPIQIYQIPPDGSNRGSRTPYHNIPSYYDDHFGPGRHCANTIVTLDDVSTLSGRPGEVFLSGWSNGLVKLHDTRASSCTHHIDEVDDGQVLSLLAIGHERVLAGSHQNGCLKVFDLRMPGRRAYSYTSTGRGVIDTACRMRKNYSPLPLYHPEVQRSARRQINVFLSIHVAHSRHLWQRLPGRRDTRLPRYRGSVYSLSSPSPSSTTLYAGIGNHIIQLDSASTDDISKNRMGDVDLGLSINKKNHDQILNIACYERPRDGHERTDSILLRKQLDWGSKGATSDKVEDGWDERWRLSTYDRQSTVGPAWRVARPR